MRLKLLYILHLVIMVSACSSSTKVKDAGTYSGMSVAVEDREDLKSAPGEALPDGKNPLFTNQFSPDQTSLPRDPVVGFYFAPAGYRSLAMIGFLNRLHFYNYPINIVSSEGFSSVMALLYAEKVEPEKLEWKAYQLLNKLNAKNAIHSDRWYSDITTHIKGYLQINKLQQTSVATYFPVIESKTGAVSMVGKGDLEHYFARALGWGTSRYGTTKSSLSHSLPPLKELRSKGVDILVSVDLLDEQLNFENGNGYLVGLFSRIAAKNKRLSEKSDIVIRLNNVKASLDQRNSFGELIGAGESLADQYIDQLRKILKNWREKNGKSK